MILSVCPSSEVSCLSSCLRTLLTCPQSFHSLPYDPSQVPPQILPNHQFHCWYVLWNRFSMIRDHIYMPWCMLNFMVFIIMSIIGNMLQLISAINHLHSPGFEPPWVLPALERVALWSTCVSHFGSECAATDWILMELLGYENMTRSNSIVLG